MKIFWIYLNQINKFYISHSYAKLLISASESYYKVKLECFMAKDISLTEASGFVLDIGLGFIYSTNAILLVLFIIIYFFLPGIYRPVSEYLKQSYLILPILLMIFQFPQLINFQINELAL